VGVTERRATPPARRALGWGALALGLVAVVAMAAHGAAWSTHRDATARSLPHAVVVAGLTVAIAIGIVIILAAMATTRSHETPEQRRRRWTTAISFVVVIALLSIVRLVFGSIHTHGSTHAPPAATGSGGAPQSVSTPRTRTGDTWWPVILVAFGTVALFVSASTRRPRSRGPSDPDAETVALLDASLDDLRNEPDPRRAVVAAYARMERRLAVRGFARRPSETPTEYLQRALGTGTAAGETVGVEPLAELTALAELARFSDATIDETMRARAVAALERLRAELHSPDAHQPATA
jgi:DMSO/TMAO reductase YedYZ heme-binding membrane subunit